MQSSPEVTEVTIPADVLKQLDDLPDKRNGYEPIAFEPWQDKVLLEYWSRKTQEDVAKIVGFGVKKCKQRYRELTFVKK